MLEYYCLNLNWTKCEFFKCEQPTNIKHITWLESIEAIEIIVQPKPDNLINRLPFEFYKRHERVFRNQN